MTSKTDKTEFEVARLRVRPQFLYVRHGKTERRKALLVQARRRKGASPGAHAGAGFTATKKIGNAVIRNRAKRRVFSCRSMENRGGIMSSLHVWTPLTLRGRVCLTIWKAR